MKLSTEKLKLLGFLKNGEHESIKNLFNKTLFPGVEIDVDYMTGEGWLFFYNPETDFSHCRLDLQYDNEEQLEIFIKVLKEITFFE